MVKKTSVNESKDILCNGNDNVGMSLYGVYDAKHGANSNKLRNLLKMAGQENTYDNFTFSFCTYQLTHMFLVLYNGIKKIYYLS